ncbi:MAG TPA: TetR/AcrR family transcriptional regulator [Caulobacter sp.]|nr:TetR/AcrR family transcriptional regulator [Caulobacter sp.]
MAENGATNRLLTTGSRRAPPAQAREGHVIDRILDSAELVLRDRGYAGFTTRRVAEAAGIAPGNLSYHYPTKLELLRALIKRLMADYSKRLQDALKQPDQGPEELLRWLLGEAFTREANSLFRELWAMALHDEVVRDAVDDFYDQVMTDVESAILAAYPTASPQGVRDLVRLMSVISEGSGVIYGLRGVSGKDHERLVALAMRLAAVVSPDLVPTAALPEALQE